MIAPSRLPPPRPATAPRQPVSVASSMNKARSRGAACPWQHRPIFPASARTWAISSVFTLAIQNHEEHDDADEKEKFQ